MLFILRLAQRNVFRNRMRTLVSILAIACGSAALIVNGGIILNIFRELREDAIHGRLGHLQVYREGYSDHHLKDPEPYLIPASEVARILDLSRRNSGVLRATTRREFSGLISNGERRAAFLGVAVEPEDDAQFSDHVTMRAGAGLSSGRPYGVIAGLGLAKKLDAAPGTTLVLMSTTASGVLNAIHVTLQGVFESGLKEYDDWTLKMPLPAANQLLLDNNSEQVVLLLKRTDDIEKVRIELDDAFRDAGLKLEFRSWRDLALFHNQVVSLFGRELSIIRLVVAAIVILGISNAIGMSILERSAELAMLRALGIRQRAIAALLMMEAFLTGLIGAAVGLMVGAIIAGVVSKVGIIYPSPPGSTRPFEGGIDLALGTIVDAFLISMLASLAAAALPIWRTVRQSIAPALRYG